MDVQLPGDCLYPASVQAGLLSRGQLLAAGVSRHRIVTLRKHGSLQHVTRNVYRVQGITAGRNLHCVTSEYDWRRRQGAWTGLLSNEHAIATGMAALALHGVWGLPARISPEITLPGLSKGWGAPGVRVRQFAQRFQLNRVHGRFIAAPSAALVQALPELGQDRTVAVVDSALNRGVIDPSEIEHVRQGLRGRRGVRSLGPWWTLIDPRAESPMETYARLDCLRAGLPAPTLQVEIRDERGSLIARSDLGWRKLTGAWVLVEIDGKEFHEAPTALFRDRERLNRIGLHGEHTVLRFTGRDVEAGKVASLVARVLREGG